MNTKENKRGWLNKTTEEFKQEIYELTDGEYSVRSEYRGCEQNVKFLHNICGYNFERTPHAFKHGRKCPVCTGKKVVIGFNDVETMKPDLVKYMVNKDDKYKHFGSGQKIQWQCPDCKKQFNRSISDVVKRGFSCPHCGDGISYPNKLIYEILSQVDGITELIREFAPVWCKFEIDGKRAFGKYDIYFIYKNNKYIVEMDGGLGHGNRSIDKTREQALLIDDKKDELAREHGITVIRIDSDYGSNDRFTFITNNIMLSLLNSLLDLKNVDFIKADKNSISSYIIKAGELWTSGLTVKEISDKMNICVSTVTNYLKQCKRYNICDYSQKESKTRSSAQKVCCLNNKCVYNSIVEAAKETGANVSSISKCCRGLQCYAGVLNGEKLKWVYYNDYIEIENGVKYIERKNKTIKKVICLNDFKIYNSIKEASEDTGIRASGIQACCMKRYKYSGIDKTTGKKLIWRYYNEYLEEQLY